MWCKKCKLEKTKEEMYSLNGRFGVKCNSCVGIDIAKGVAEKKARRKRFLLKWDKQMSHCD